MKKYKILSVLVMCLSSLMMVSCLGDDDEDSSVLTAQQRAACLAKVKGEYSGWMLHNGEAASEASSLSTVKVDTTQIRFSINGDTTLTVYDIPSSAFAVNVTDPSLKTALCEQENVDLTADIYFYKADPVSFLLDPVTINYNLTYDGVPHKVSVVFYVNSYYSWGVYKASDSGRGLINMQIVQAAVYVDENTARTNMTTSSPFAIVNYMTSY